MNRYSTNFFCACPNNGVRIEYRLTIESGTVLSVEDIIEGIGINTDEPEYHETLADLLLERFGGQQTLVANHHGVTIETERSENP